MDDPETALACVGISQCWRRPREGGCSKIGDGESAGVGKLVHGQERRPSQRRTKIKRLLDCNNLLCFKCRDTGWCSPPATRRVEFASVNSGMTPGCGQCPARAWWKSLFSALVQHFRVCYEDWGYGSESMNLCTDRLLEFLLESNSNHLLKSLLARSQILQMDESNQSRDFSPWTTSSEKLTSHSLVKEDCEGCRIWEISVQIIKSLQVTRLWMWQSTESVPGLYRSTRACIPRKEGSGIRVCTSKGLDVQRGNSIGWRQGLKRYRNGHRELHRMSRIIRASAPSFRSRIARVHHDGCSEENIIHSSARSSRRRK